MLATLGALVTTGLGLLGMGRPAVAARLVSLAPQGLVGLSEMRATYGGLFAAMGAYALWAPTPTAFALLAMAWSGAACGRALSVVVDASRSPQNLGALAFEAAIAALCWSGA